MLAGLALLVVLLIRSAAFQLQQRGIATGFDFLVEPAGFQIGEGLLSFESGMPYWFAFLAGLANTVRVVLPAMALALLLGGIVGLGQQSGNFLVRSAARAYVELFRNLPLLLQLLAWYALLTEFLPAANAAWQPVPGFLLSKSGLAFPYPAWEGGGLLLALPQLGEGGIAGGGNLSPEFLTIFLGLSLYTGAYLAECVRGAISAIPAGQREAAAALGFSPWQVWRWVVLPQAWRVFIPPASNQFLSLIKNSSLAVAVGYPDIVSVANTSINQTGRAAECILIILVVFALLSVLTSFVGRSRHVAG